MKMYQDKKKIFIKGKEISYKENKKKKGIVFGCIGIMIGGLIFLIISSLLKYNDFFVYITLAICAIAVLIIYFVDATYDKRHLEEHSNIYRDKLNILHDLLTTQFNIFTVEKLDQLIIIFQKVLEKKEMEEKRRRKALYFIFVGLGGILTVSLENISLLGVTFNTWLLFFIVLFIVLGIVLLYVYIIRLFDSVKIEYECMVKDLENLRLINY